MEHLFRRVPIIIAGPPYYVVKRVRWSKAIGLTALVLILIPTFGAALAADVIYVETKERYEPGDNVEVKGYTNVTATVTVIITNSTDEIILTDNPNAKGKFSVEFTLGEDASGLYEVNATVGDIYDTTSFEVVVESDEGAGDNPGDEVMTLEDLLSAIARARWFIDKANTTATALQEEGYDMTLFWVKLNWLNDSLTEIYKNIDPNDIAASFEDLRDIRNEISQLSGLLSSITKNVEGEKAKQFTERMMRRIGDLKGRIDGVESAGVNEFRSNLDAHEKKLYRLWLTLNSTIPHDELESILKELDGVTQGVDSGFGLLGDEGYTLKEMYKLQARIDVFNATVERMKVRGKNMTRLQEKLDNAKGLMEQMEADLSAKNWGKMKDKIGDANENLRGVGKTIREMNKSNKGGNGKSNGNKKGN